MWLKSLIPWSPLLRQNSLPVNLDRNTKTKVTKLRFQHQVLRLRMLWSHLRRQSAKQMFIRSFCFMCHMCGYIICDTNAEHIFYIYEACDFKQKRTSMIIFTLLWLNHLKSCVDQRPCSGDCCQGRWRCGDSAAQFPAFQEGGEKGQGQERGEMWDKKEKGEEGQKG